MTTLYALAYIQMIEKYKRHLRNSLNSIQNLVNLKRVWQIICAVVSNLVVHVLETQEQSKV